jgi:hypothetical protein
MFQMQAWESVKRCTCDIDKIVDGVHQDGCPYPMSPSRWEPMEYGAAKAAWRPRKTHQEAVYKCLTWTGLVGIPAMQVVDMETGEVLWRDSAHYPAAGPPIEPEWATKLRSQVKREQQKQAEAERAELTSAGPEQGALF